MMCGELGICSLGAAVLARNKLLFSATEHWALRIVCKVGTFTICGRYVW